MPENAVGPIGSAGVGDGLGLGPGDGDGATTVARVESPAGVGDGLGGGVGTTWAKPIETQIN
jgi:hypothetical protein